VSAEHDCYLDRKPPEAHVCELVLSVADNGIGIDPEFAERIFAIFQRLHTRQECAGAGYRLYVRGS
jgi:light-regulated signal transduction histidine kinase (bacteriophytochrome)